MQCVHVRGRHPRPCARRTTRQASPSDNCGQSFEIFRRPEPSSAVTQTIRTLPPVITSITEGQSMRFRSLARRRAPGCSSPTRPTARSGPSWCPCTTWTPTDPAPSGGAGGRRRYPAGARGAWTGAARSGTANDSRQCASSSRSAGLLVGAETRASTAAVSASVRGTVSSPGRRASMDAESTATPSPAPRAASPRPVRRPAGPRWARAPGRP